MKDEFKGQIISEFARLKLKMYSLISVDNEEVTRAKGVNKKKSHKEFVSILFNEKVMRHILKLIRYLLDDGVNTLAYFHKDIKN